MKIKTQKKQLSPEAKLQAAIKLVRSAVDAGSARIALGQIRKNYGNAIADEVEKELFPKPEPRNMPERYYRYNDGNLIPPKDQKFGIAPTTKPCGSWLEMERIDSAAGPIADAVVEFRIAVENHQRDIDTMAQNISIREVRLERYAQTHDKLLKQLELKKSRAGGPDISMVTGHAAVEAAAIQIQLDSRAEKKSALEDEIKGMKCDLKKLSKETVPVPEILNQFLISG